MWLRVGIGFYQGLLCPVHGLVPAFMGKALDRNGMQWCGSRSHWRLML